MSIAEKNFDLVHIGTCGYAELVPRKEHIDTQIPRLPLFTVGITQVTVYRHLEMLPLVGPDLTTNIIKVKVYVISLLTYCQGFSVVVV